MVKIPVRFERVAAAFNEASRARQSPCDSSGSDHSPETTPYDLSDLVNCFIERDNEDVPEIEHEEETECSWLDSETRDKLKSLFSNDDDDAKHKIFAETELALGVIGDRTVQDLKRRLMSHLRDRGFDAGLCKSWWERFGRHPAGCYEYVDLNINGTRYIIEVHLAGEFEIARPTNGYLSLLNLFPKIFVGKPEELKKVTSVMCNGIRESMKSVSMDIPPWRRNGFVQAKWFSHYKRTTNESPTKVGDQDVARRTILGFEASPVKAYNCRDDYGRKDGMRFGHLTAAFNGSGNGR
ncbi:hypothetical protein HS088_TW21G01034 [Tripterygium wilfordii]|uniref:DUF506 family protein n=1 Tax=Tripterygium wilfordii TaxID=458696 RepID=A0A7J7C407_TRIWF|nr:uncharacterized protein LOC119987657 [Tripterygium wilfordii]KAF5728880.1 hypothetical protein HS088_TW21G01034 [Tripterygium wilfordii]